MSALRVNSCGALSVWRANANKTYTPLDPIARCRVENQLILVQLIRRLPPRAEVALDVLFTSIGAPKGLGYHIIY